MAPIIPFRALLLVLVAVPSFQQASAFSTPPPTTSTPDMTTTTPDMSTITPPHPTTTTLHTSFADVIPIDNDLFYPYGPNEGDTANPANDDGGSDIIGISFSFPYFNHLHDSLWVNTNGVISFLGQIAQYTPDSFPLGDGRRLITPFWGDVDTRNGGFVMYRETTDPNILARATTDIRLTFPYLPNFQAAWAFVATWHEVAYFGSGSEKRNTFQAVLVSNGRQSFTIFNYGNITWTTGTASGGDELTGLGGTPAQVGFNAGDGIVYYSVNGSQTDAIVDVETTSNVNLPGRWIFRIDSYIEEGGCNADASIRLCPFFGTMLGGTKVGISGPCFDEYMDIRCKFGANDPVPGWVESDTTAACISPFLSNPGRVPLMVSTDGGNTYDYWAMYTSVHPDRLLPQLRTTENAADETITIEWQLSSVDGNTVNVYLYGFDETAGTWDVVAQLGSDVPNTGSYTLSIADGWIPEDVATGALSISPGNGGTGMLLYGGIATYVSVRATAAASCDAWCLADSLLPDFVEQLSREIPCPATLNQARGDVGNFEADEACLRVLDSSAATNKMAACCWMGLEEGHQIGYTQIHRWAWFWGDPHFVTLNGVPYTFNGAGEFVLLTVNNGEFLAQARMEQLFSDGSPVDATIFTALAMKEGSSETVQLQLSEVRTMDVIVDGELMDFQDLTVQEFSGFTVTVEEAAEAQISFDSGIGVIVSAMEGMLSIAMKLPFQMKGQTLGLLGKWNEEAEDDLTTPNGTVVAADSSTEDIHYLFGLTWMIDEADSLFTYGPGESYDIFKNTEFTPTFELPLASAEFQAQAEEVCGTDNQACLFDVLTTGRLAVANVSIRAKREYTEEIEELITCGPLDPPNVPGTLIIPSYSIGSVATFECEVGVLATAWERVCQPGGTWSYAPPPVCEVCARPYQVRYGMCVRFVPRPMNYPAAVAYCQNDQAELLPVRNPAVIEDADRRLLRRGPCTPGLWSGLTDAETEGTWIWHDGVAYVSGNIPGNSAAADCAYLTRRAGLELRVTSCDNSRKTFICKR
ncbi:PREDICTED: sushi domain-containing protein 2-like [Branchiostoma belcheri]|uniref:Sushi domain-containing protein 2-like n=1 Tax=Branchiostoma belcheri TaxID=7741 RepID=A0A6P5A598_BRABE|nr:PREDICTED: sushi domain-containing protein 2-like [Branchiostoma belcheri]